MKVLLSFLLASLLGAGFSCAQTDPTSHLARGEVDATSRFIFYSVLEGLYEDGVSNQDVDQILMKKEKQTYFHFIYACPICTATIWALEAYRSRPAAFYGLKGGEGATFGPGLSDRLHQQLYSADPHQRLAAINTMMQGWMARRMERMNLSENERSELEKALEKKREEGMRYLKGFRSTKNGPSEIEIYAPAYSDLTECAVCNGAVGKPMKLPADDGK